MLARMNTQPASFWQDIHQDMDQWFAVANSQLDNSARWLAAVDVVEHNDHYVLKADLPGIAREDIEIVYQDNALTIKGERSASNHSENEGYKHIERSYGMFQRTFHLPENIDAENISATSENGVLSVHIPKQEKAHKKIEVR